jgi:hypothetical protein
VRRRKPWARSIGLGDAIRYGRYFVVASLKNAYSQGLIGLCIANYTRATYLRSYRAVNSNLGHEKCNSIHL